MESPNKIEENMMFVFALQSEKLMAKMTIKLNTKINSMISFAVNFLLKCNFIMFVDTI